MEAIWRVQMLGGLQADSEDISLSRFRTRKVGLLLAYLSYYRGRRHSRDELADMLWPDADPDSAKTNLRQSLASLRRNLEPPGVPPGAVIDADRSSVSISDHFVHTDVEEFKRCLHPARDGQASAARAVQLYRGELLPGFYEDWVLRERLALEDLYVSALKTCIVAAEAKCQFDEAIQFARLALGRDAFQGDLHTTLIRLYLSSGRNRSAMQQFEAWRTICLEELGTEPDPAVVRLIESVEKTEMPLSSSDVQGPAALTPTTNAPEPRAETVAKLPVQLTRFFGREKELRQVLECIELQSTRLITLVGPAGTGKTRLSIEIGKAVSKLPGWNVWFVPLADLSDGAELLTTTLATLKVGVEGSSSIEALADRLAEASNLIILDNLEHILDRAAQEIETIVQGVPNVTLLVTSRQALKLGGEQEIELYTLPVPAAEDGESPVLAGLFAVPSVQLFVDRSQSVLADFQLTARNARSISQICTRLEGLPLAIELAASLSGAFSPPQLLQNLDNRLELLQSRRRDLTGRHRSLRLAIDYSFHLLSEDLKQFFIRLSVFRGGFSIEAAKRICLEEGQGDSTACLRKILDLQERSFVQPHDSRDDSPARFKLLESYREYGREILTPEDEAKLRRRHADYFLALSLAKTLEPEDRDNRKAAVRTFFDQKAVPECVALLTSFEFFTPLDREVVHAMATSNDFAGFEPLDQVRILQLRTDALVYQSNYDEALRACQRARDIAAKFNMAFELERANARVALVLSFQERLDEAISQSQYNLDVAIASGNLIGAQTAYTMIGATHQSLQNFDLARQAYEGARTVCKERRGGQVDWLILYNLAVHLLEGGRLEEGLKYAGEALKEARTVNDEFGVSLATSAIARYHHYAGNLHAALGTNHAVMKKMRQVGFLHWTFQSIFDHAAVLTEMGEFRVATTLFAAALSVAQANRSVSDKYVQRLRLALPSAEFAEAWAEGLTMSSDQAFRLAAQFK